jgi:putative transposase
MTWRFAAAYERSLSAMMRFGAILDHRRIKRRVRPTLGFKSTGTARIILSGIEMVHMMRKRQARYAFNPNPSLAEQFAILTA